MPTDVDRRKFLKYTGVAGAATGALWAAPSVLGSSSAFATGSACYSPQTLHWTDYASLGSAAVPNHLGTTTFSMQVAANGLEQQEMWVRVTVRAVPALSVPPGKGTSGNGLGGINEPTGGHSDPSVTSYYMIDMANATASGYQMTLDFFADSSFTTSINVSNLRFDIVDIDHQSGIGAYTDQVWLTPGFTVINQGAEVFGGGRFSNPWLGTAPVSDSTGTVVVQYDGPINSVSLDYRAYQLLVSGNQLIQVGDLTWC